MATTQKVSVSVDAKELRWMKSYARRRKLSVSSLLSEAVRNYREETAMREAQEAFVSSFSDSERATPEEMDALEAEWRA